MSQTRRSKRLGPVPLLALLSAFILSLWSPAISPVAAQSANTTLDIVVHTCPDGVDPVYDASSCTTVVDAAPAAHVDPSGQDAIRLDAVERTPNGGYRVTWNHANGVGPVEFTQFAPENYNYFTFAGLDENWKWGGAVYLAGGSHRTVDVYYYNGNEPLIMPAENTVILSVRDCPPGVDPTVDPSSCIKPTAPADMGDLQYILTLDSGPVANLTPAPDGTYVLEGLPAYTRFGLTGSYVFDGEVETVSTDPPRVTAYLLRNEVRKITAYRKTGGPAAEVGPDEAGGRIVVSLRSCPAGIDTIEEVSPDACPMTVQDDGSGQVTTSGGESRPLAEYPVVNGAYDINAAPGHWSISGLAPVESDGMLVTGGQSDGSTIGVDVVSGETSYIDVYYVNHD